MSISLLHRKESVVLTAIEIIDELGIQGFSTREIAKRQKISEGTIYKHFNSKNEIVLAVLEYYSKFDLAIYEATLVYIAKSEKPSDMLSFWINAYVTYYENYPAITALLQLYDVLSYDPVLRDMVQAIHAKRLGYLNVIITTIQDRGDFSPSIDTTILADIVFGTFREVCLTWRMAGRTFSLRDRVLASMSVIAEFATI